jgi:hypothetical protein
VGGSDPRSVRVHLGALASLRPYPRLSTMARGCGPLSKTGAQRTLYAVACSGLLGTLISLFFLWH